MSTEHFVDPTEHRSLRLLLARARAARQSPIASLRKYRGMSIPQLATASGLSAGTLTAIEGGLVASLGDVERLAATLHCPPVLLLS